MGDTQGVTWGHSPHVEGSHQPYHVLPIFGELELGDLRWVKVRRVVFLWGVKVSGELFQAQGQDGAEGRAPGSCPQVPRATLGLDDSVGGLLGLSTHLYLWLPLPIAKGLRDTSAVGKGGRKVWGDQAPTSRVFSRGNCTGHA